MHHALRGALLSFLAATPAWAQAPVTPVDPAPPPGAYYHGGFYLRGGAGLAWTHARFSRGGIPGEAVASGFGEAMSFAIGGAIAQKLMLAFDVGGNQVRPSTSSPEVTGVSFYHVLGLLDWYPNPYRGLHFELGGGVSVVDYSARTLGGRLDSAHGGNGFAWHLGAGWEGWIGEQWSLGALLRLDGTQANDSRLDETGGSVTISVIAPSLLIMLTYN